MGKPQLYEDVVQERKFGLQPPLHVRDLPDRLAAPHWLSIAAVEERSEFDSLSAMADPEKNLVRPLGILGIEIDKKVAAMAPDLRDPFGIIVAARSSDASGEIPLQTGDVIRTLNGEPMTTLDRLRQALAALKPGSPVAIQIQRDERLMYVSFTLEQPL